MYTYIFREVLDGDSVLFPVKEELVEPFQQLLDYVKEYQRKEDDPEADMRHVITESGCGLELSCVDEVILIYGKPFHLDHISLGGIVVSRSRDLLFLYRNEKGARANAFSELWKNVGKKSARDLARGVYIVIRRILKIQYK
jgi:hypothetical protein